MTTLMDFQPRLWRRPHVGSPHAVGVPERPVRLPRRYPTLSPIPVTFITITDRILWFLGCGYCRRYALALARLRAKSLRVHQDLHMGVVKAPLCNCHRGRDIQVMLAGNGGFATR